MLILQLSTGIIFAQSHYYLENDKGFYKQKFELVNDLVIVPVEINGAELSFLLDTGVNATIIFSLQESDSVEIKDPTTIYLRGLGAGKPIRALKSTNNVLRLGEAVSTQETIYIVDEKVMGLSNRLGVEVNGIMGYEFFRSFVVEFNYPREFMKIYPPENYRYKKCNRCEDIPLNFDKNKPFILANIEFENSRKEVKLLLDSGSGDALWLFPSKKENINVPQQSFKDFLGFGISGSVYGDRSRIKSLNLGRYTLKSVTASFPDSLYIGDIATFEERNGSLGGQVLKRFNWVIDYPGKMIRIKPNRKFREPFEYNMSGLVVEHNGYHVVKNADEIAPQFAIEENERTGGIEVYRSSYQVKFTLEPQYQIAEIRPDSPAEIEGLKKGDIILELNKKPAHKYSLDEISKIFSSREGRKIKIIIEREGREIEYAFYLKRIL